MPAGPDFEERTIASIDAAFDDAAGHLNAQHGRLVANAMWMLDNKRDWQGDGLWRLDQYIALRTGVSSGTARKVADIAQHAADFPDCVAALMRGELSLDQLAPIVRHAPGWCDRQMAGLAPRCTVAQVSRIARKYPWDHGMGSDDSVDGDVGSNESAACADGVDQTTDGSDSSAPTAPADSCWWGFDDSGRFRLWLETDQEQGAIIDAALDEARDALFQSTGATPSGASTVLEVAQRSLDTVDSPSRRNRFRINIHLDATGVPTENDSASTSPTARATDGRGNALPDAIARHLSCDGVVTPVFIDSGLPISVGRTERIVPDRTRRLVEHRDHGCRVPGCTTSRFVEVHHIIHWTDDGPTDTWNLICLCPAHHRLHHRGHLGITGNADEIDGVTFTDRHGRDLFDWVARPRPPDRPPPPIDGVFEHPLGERLDGRFLYFNDDPRRPEPTSSNPPLIAPPLTPHPRPDPS